jgi:hypothetical protein
MGLFLNAPKDHITSITMPQPIKPLSFLCMVERIWKKGTFLAILKQAGIDKSAL